MAPVFEAAAKEFEPRLRFAKVDTDAEQSLAARYHIQAIPTMVLVRGGRELARHSGAMPGRRATLLDRAASQWVKASGRFVSAADTSAGVTQPAA